MADIFRIAVSVIVLSLFFGNAVRADYPIAGVTPDQRPQGAPVVTSVERDQNWYAWALRGISQPYPNSLKFLENQGNWYTPFTRPGAPGPYDIRGLHSK